MKVFAQKSNGSADYNVVKAEEKTSKASNKRGHGYKLH